MDTMDDKAKSDFEHHELHGLDETIDSGKAINDVAAAIYDSGAAPNPWGRGHLQLYGMCIIIYLCSTMNGYDGSLMGSINALPEYHEYFGLGTQGSTSTGLVFSIFQIGQMAGALFTWVCDWRGRKWIIIINCALVCVSVVFTALAPTLTSFIGARFLLSFFSTIATVAAPLLLVELAPPLHRGLIAGFYNTLWYMGSIIATFSLYGADLHLTGNIKWRLPLWLQLLCPGLVVVFGVFIPESPRWLIANNRHEQARRFLVKHHANGDESSPVVAIEMNEIEASLADVNLNNRFRYFDLRSLFKTRARRYRLMLAITMAWFGQFSGNNVSSYYLPVMLENVGITTVSTVLLLNAVYAITGWLAAIIGARLHDKVGRRKMLMGSCVAMSIALAVVSATTAIFERNGSTGASSASIAFIYIFGVSFAIAFTPMQPIYPAEVLSNDMRANGMMMFQLVSGCASFVNTFAAPVAMEKIRFWFYVFFVFWDLFELGFIYFFFVETKGRTLEELDAVFEASNPRKASLKRMADMES
ncbi:general substrate transporter [Naematelia encephala]|uniref:General substrate transporter n=1 Tax=Naematelia encephala TaxID=71784 RepID=A0A1Y2AHU3_9TREE|nr:general substrate transporter [Naematelia encephala]